jgi:hypothetical protein
VAETVQHYHLRSLPGILALAVGGVAALMVVVHNRQTFRHLLVLWLTNEMHYKLIYHGTVLLMMDGGQDKIKQFSILCRFKENLTPSTDRCT